MSEFREVLHEWGSHYVPAGSEVTKVSLHFEKDFTGTWVEVLVWYLNTRGASRSVYVTDTDTLAALFRELFYLSEDGVIDADV